jgi:hypothetical protein
MKRKAEDENENENEDENEDEDEDEDETKDECCRLTHTPGAPGLPTTFFSEQRRGGRSVPWVP